MNNNKLSTGIEEIDKELSKGSSLEEFVKFHIGSELQPYQKQIVNIIESNENISTEEFAKQYNLNLRKRSNRINILSTPLNNDSACYAYHFLKPQSKKVEKKKDFTEMLRQFKLKQRDEFRTEYMLQPLQIGKTFKNTKRDDRKERCGDCTFFGDKGCTTSYLEAKYGNAGTPACDEFSPKILGIKATMIIYDDPIKKD